MTMPERPRRAHDDDNGLVIGVSQLRPVGLKEAFSKGAVGDTFLGESSDLVGDPRWELGVESGGRGCALMIKWSGW